MSKSHELLTRSMAIPAPPPDEPARDAALDVSGSWIVQAPAGAGKTELLTQRFLKLLSVVDAPEEILAITFTRAATAEMRGRIIAALEEAAHTLPLDTEPRTLQLARCALARSKSQGWQLLEQPHRLDVQTIDSLCLRLAHGQPLLSRLGGQLAPTEQAAALYEQAAQRTFALLGRAPAELEAALAHLLLLRDNNLTGCQQLIARMLENREQWRHVFILSADATVDWTEVRTRLEAPFAAEISRVLGQLHTTLTAEPTLVEELLALARYACGNGNSRASITLLDGLQSLPLPDAHFVDHWGCLHNFLLTAGKWRKAFNKLDGFPTDGANAPKLHQRQQKHRMEQLMQRFSTHPSGERLRTLLSRVPALPAARYNHTQWQTLLSVFRVLRRAVAELHVVFAERNQVDFAELSIAAATVLDDQENTRGLLASEATRHLLIDEFQDTSRRQHQLIGRLLHEWQPGDGRTCFLVGDPMQSIYIFRQAEVELFGRVQRQGLDCGTQAHPCTGLTLSENFRSHRGLVDPLNRHFTAIFGDPPDEARDSTQSSTQNEVPFAPSTAAAPAIEGLDAVQVHAFFCSSREPNSAAAARDAQIARVVELVEQELPRIAAHAAPSFGAKTYTLAILGRAKNHLAPIAQALRARGIAFRAVELEALAERQEILDLQSLLRALLHPMDRIAWLSVLRAPWCGLTLGDLHTLTGADAPGFHATSVPDLIAERAHLLTPDGRQRLARVSAILTRAAADAFGPVHAQSLAAWVERTWTSLGAPAYLTTGERENAESFFRLLDGLPPDGIDALNGNLDAALQRLCAAPDSSVSEHFGVQLMTIHKAKGLGFEVVIVPSLERQPGGDSLPLVTLLERARPDAAADDVEQDEVLIAPLGTRGEQHRTYKWVQSTRSARQAGERKRLFYVACTRARRQLHLLGTAEISSTGDLRPGASDSLLACAWPALGPIYAAARQAQLRQPLMPQPEQSPLMPGTFSGTFPGTFPGTFQPPQPGRLDRLAATGALPLDASSAETLRLWRVPSGFNPELLAANVTVTGTYPRMGAHANHTQFTRPEGSFEQRARGNAVHAMLELVSETWARSGAAANPTPLAPQLERLARTTLGRAGLAPSRVDALSPSLVSIVLAAAAHPEGQWLLSPHPGAQSEWSFSGWTTAGEADARLRTLRVDRVLRAGDAPLSQGSQYLWIIDYKTGGNPGGIALDAYLEAQKEQWRPQLETYGSALRAFHRESLKLRYALYFPELLQLKSWHD